MTAKAERASKAAAARAATIAGDSGSAAADDVRLARLHLRLGMLSLALAELEDLERRTLLDGSAQALLAEARWRTGDAEGATAAARAHLDAGGSAPVAVAIAAEATAADGRPGEARSLMERLGPVDAAALDELFAGMPRRGFWPSAPAETGAGETLFGEVAPPGGRPAAARLGRTALVADEALPALGSAQGAMPSRRSAIAGPAEVLEAATRGLWTTPTSDATPPAEAATDGDRGAAVAAAPTPRPRPASLSLVQDPVAELTRARAELEANPDRALLRLALILRLDPTLAPAVLDAIGVRTEPAAAILRGDAQRLLGRHLEAEAAFASAADGLAGGPDPRS